MEFIRYEIHENDADRRIDRILRRFLPGLPLSAVYRLIRKGGVRLNGARVQPGTLCPAGSVLEIDRRQAGMHTKDSRPDAAPPENPDSRTAEGKFFPVSIKLILLELIPITSAKISCVSDLAARNSLILAPSCCFRSISIRYKIPIVIRIKIRR